MNTTVMIIGAVVMAIMGIAAFALMGYDKNQAKKHGRRVPEKTLFLVTALFGGLGGVLGMSVFRHKTKHWYFVVFFPLFLVIQVGLIVFLSLKV